VGFLPILILHLASLGYLLTRPVKTRATRLFIGWMISLMLLMTSQGLARMIYAPVSGYIDWMGGAAFSWASLILALEFAYTFPRPVYPREARRLRIGALALGLGPLLLMPLETALHFKLPVYNFTQFWFALGVADTKPWLPFTSMLILSLPVGYLWVWGVWLRKTVHFSQAATPELPATPHPRLWLPLRDGLAALWRPQGREARAARAFTLVLTIVPLVIITSALEQIAILPAGSFAAAYMPSMFALTVIYLNYSLEPSTLMVRLVGLTLLAILVILEVMNGLVLDLYRQADESVRLAEVATVRTLLENNLAGAMTSTREIPAQVIYIAARPSTGGLFSTSYHMLFARETAAPPLTAQTLTDEDAQLAHRLQQGQLEVWMENPWMGSVYQAQDLLAHHPPARMTLPAGLPTYRGVYSPSPDEHYIRYAFPSADEQTLYEVGFSYLSYRQRLHRQALPLVWLTLGGTGLILLIYPLFFRSNLAHPLESLLTGVQKVNTGDLSVSVPVQVEDEVGFLTRSFNGMVASLQQLDASLRLEIGERLRAETALRASEARFRNLFEYSPLSVFEVNLTHTPPVILHANRQATRVFDRPPTAWGQAPLDCLFPPQALGALTQLTDALHGRILSVETVGQRGNGTLFPIRVSAAAEAGPVSEQIILAIEDITAEKARRTEEEAIAEERRRIAREIHDGLAQDLAALRLRADVWHTLVERDPAQLHLELERLKTVLGKNIHEVRRSIFALRPLPLEELGFYPALHQFVRDLGEQSQLQLDLQIVGPPDRLPPALELVLFRIIQEALNNISKHAHASTSWITLHLDAAEGVTLQVRDDGLGFDLAAWEKTPPRTHLGLAQMRERVEALRGRFRVDSQPGQGTLISVALPREVTG
jgi:signal transduction histidine kinase